MNSNVIFFFIQGNIINVLFKKIYRCDESNVVKLNNDFLDRATNYIMSLLIRALSFWYVINFPVHELIISWVV